MGRDLLLRYCCGIVAVLKKNCPPNATTGSKNKRIRLKNSTSVADFKL
jgi:hypothetical protein